MSNTLLFSCTHLPFVKKGYLEFLKQVQRNYKCESVFCLGDLVDNHAISYHEHDPNGRSAGDELTLAKKELKKWYRAFPKLSLCKGNHDILVKRKAKTHGVPDSMIKSFREVFELPNKWKYEWNYQYNGMHIEHGTGYSGQYGHVNALKVNRINTVIGHLHSVASVYYSANDRDLIWSMCVGCGIDRMQYAFWYGKDFQRKPIIATGVVLDGRLPIVIPMKT